ncbi:hypothetical protein SLA2020_073360 [Shorea laevis]
MRRVGDEAAGSWRFALLVFFILISGAVTVTNTPDTDRESLPCLKVFLEDRTSESREIHAMNQTTSNPFRKMGLGSSK